MRPVNTYNRWNGRILCLVLLLTVSCQKSSTEASDSIQGIQVQCILSGLKFAEGPAFYNNRLYFSDIEANRIYTWNETEGMQVFTENSGAANGLYFNKDGLLFACQGGNRRVVSIDQSHNVTVVADTFDNKPFNEPNDLWISPAGNIYFTDPVFTGTQSQSGQDVYCVLASTGAVMKVIDDLVKPNGIVGTSDGQILYVADWGGSKIYRYSISADGSLGDKQFFAEIQADGLDTDSEGNLYAAGSSLMKYSSSGSVLENTSITGTLTNICVVENNDKVIYATTHSQVYKIKTQ